MTTIEDLAQEFSGNLRDKIEGIPAVIGRNDGNGTYTVLISGKPNYVYVRLYGLASQTVEAKNLRTIFKANLGVRVRKNSDKEYEVLGVDPNIGGIFLGESAAAANVPVMGEFNTVILPDEQFKPFRCRPYDGFLGWIELGIYNSIVLGGTTFDLESAVTALSGGNQSWVIVSLSPTTNAATVTQGTVIEPNRPLLLEDALAISYPAGDLRLWAFKLKGEDTTVPGEQSRSISLRNWLGGQALTVQEVDGTPAVNGVTNIRVSNGTLTDDGNGQVTIAVGGMNSFDVGADSGTYETVSDGEVLTIAGGTGLSSVVSSPRTVTTNLDNTAVTPGSYTNTNLTVDAQGRITAATSGSGSSGSTADYILIEDQKAQNTPGGTFSAGAERTRDLNTKVSDNGVHASITKLAFTSGGTYEVVEGDTITGATSGSTATVFNVELASGTWAGGDAAGNLWLNTQSAAFQSENLNVGANSNVATIAGDSTLNQIRLKTGTYRFNITCPAYNVRRHRAILQNITDSTTAKVGSASYARDGSADGTAISLIKGAVTIAAYKTFEVWHRCEVSSASTNGFGIESNFGTEVYTQAEFWKDA